MAGHLETMLRNVRILLDDKGRLRYLRSTTTDFGSALGHTLIDTTLLDTYNDDWWIDCECLLGSGDMEGLFRIVEDSTESGGVLSFTNNTFPQSIASSVVFELFERGSFSGIDLKKFIIDAVNFIARVLPKGTLENYIVTQSVGGVAGVADPPSNALDLHMVTIGGKPGIPIPPGRRYRLTSGLDSYLSTSTSNRYLFYWEGASSVAGQLKYAPATNQTVIYHKIPLFTAFDSSGNTTFPTKFHDAVCAYAANLAWLAKGQTEGANAMRRLAEEALASQGIKIKTLWQQGPP